MKNIFIFPIILFLSGPLMAISCTKSDPESLAPVPEEPDPGPVWDPETERGWYDAPYRRYEAEGGSCVGSCTFLSPSDRISDLQSEASNDVAAQLVAQGDYVEWICQEAADGMVVRFSIPDAPAGGGTKGTLLVKVDGQEVCQVVLDSYWAWQYKEPRVGDGAWYFDNTPAAGKYARMRFDEVRVKLPARIPVGASFRLEKADSNTTPYTIDFVELEPIPAAITYESILDGTNVRYDAETDGPLNEFVIANAGRTIFLPPGRYEVNEKIWLTSPNTRIVGAGVWYTEIYFPADPSDASTYANRGIRNENQDGCSIENLYINTANERRYFDYQGGIPMGKGAEGDWGKGSSLKNVWIEHFECAAWVTADELLISGCRMRNNYADGINLCGSSRDCIVEHSDFRNNGDDNLASWSSSSAFDGPAEHLVFRYCTSELGWRAAAVGIFGGRGHSLHNLLIRDQCESGMRMVTEFAGPGFAEDEWITVDKVTIENCGVRSGAIGEYGSIGGGEASSLDLSSAGLYDLHHVKFSNLDIVNSQWNGISMTSNDRYVLRDIYFENVRIDGWQNLGLDFENAAGEVFYRNLVLEHGNGPEQDGISEGFSFTQF